jgi:hypothetical protein
MSTILPVFPSTGSIPPACFYDRQGLANWLNQNPTYKNYFIQYPDVFPNLYPMTSTLSSVGYSTQNVPLASNVTTLTQNQAMKYNEQLELFRTVYVYNSNAYTNYVQTGTIPAYFRFQTYRDRNEFKASVSLVNKLYPFQAMAYGTNESGSTLGWIVPFPM